MKKVGAWIVAVIVIVGSVLAVMNSPTTQERQRECEKRCAPRMGVWRPDPNYPAVPQGKTVPMVCQCR